jgi:hypothetical protein
MLLRRKPVVRVKNILGDDVYGLWHVKRILINKEGRRYVLIPNKERFKTKEGAEYYAHLRTRRFIEGDRGRNQKNTVQWRAALKHLCTAAFVSLMTAVAVQCWRDQPKNLDYSHKEGPGDLIKRVG